MVVAALAVCACACSESPEVKLRKTLAAQTTGIVHLPSGTIEISSELVVAAGAHDLEIVGAGTLLKVKEGFQGRAALVIEKAKNIRLRDFNLEGDRVPTTPPVEAAPPENAFRVWYKDNGVLADQVEGLEIADMHFANMVAFPILVSRSNGIKISGVTIEESGSLNARHRNNYTGGILIEEGSAQFEVRDSVFRRITGNALWTHSLRTSPRLRDGVFANNRFDTVGRDAIQVGHASNIRVENNTGSRIGYPEEAVDSENGGTPVAIDTSGNVDGSVYSQNRFEDINGKCFDLDGFHDGAVKDNQCINRRQPEEYQFGHFGIVMNNTDPDVRSRNIEVSGNVIDGTKYGGLFLMGSGHRVINNQFLHLDTSECNENSAKFACIYKADEPNMLQSGIYLGGGVARMEETRGNTIRGNRIMGHKMATRCISAGPGVSLAANTVEGNRCEDFKRTR